MRWYGKILGLFAGWLLLRHPAGGLLGLLIGHAFDADWLRRPRTDPYAVLGLSQNADMADVERAYRRLISQYHPDKLIDAPQDLRDQAEKRAGEINRAYEQIQKLRKK